MSQWNCLPSYEGAGSFTNSDFEEQMQSCQSDAPNSTKAGRRKKQELTLDERREKNREAARKSRQKVKDQIDDLEQKLFESNEENRKLRSHVERVDQKNEILRNLLEERGFHVPETLKANGLKDPKPLEPYVSRKPYERDQELQKRKSSARSEEHNSLGQRSSLANFEDYSQNSTPYSYSSNFSSSSHSPLSAKLSPIELPADYSKPFMPQQTQLISRPQAIALDLMSEANYWPNYSSEPQTTPTSSNHIQYDY